MPEGTADVYLAADVWKQFRNIDDGHSHITGIESDTTTETVAYYDL